MSDEIPEILNHGYEFVRQTPLGIRRLFDSIPQKALLHEGEALFRFLEPGFNGTSYEFWLPVETYHHFRLTSVPAWAIWRNAASRGPVAPATFCIATLTRAVYGFKGLSSAARKKVITFENLSRSGLVWIPGVEVGHFRLKYYSLGISLPRR